MSLKGKIIKIEGKTAKIEIEQQSSCGSCRGCFRSLRKNNDNIYIGTLYLGENNDKNINIGDKVDIAPSIHINQALSSLLVFGLPLIGFLTGLICIPKFFELNNEYAELITFFGSLLTLAIFTIPSAIYSKIISIKQSGKPEFIISSLNENQCENQSKKIPQIIGEQERGSFERIIESSGDV